jgi:hypothetical protein
MVVELTVPSTRTLWPFVTALAEVTVVPFSYLVEDFSSTVTLWPVDVVIVKLDVGTVATMPIAPPCAGADRALDGAVEEVGATSCAGVAEAEVATTTGSPIAAHISVAAAIRPLLLYARNRWALRLRACLAAGTQAGRFDEKDSKLFITVLLSLGGNVHSACRCWEIPPKPLKTGCDGADNLLRMPTRSLGGIFRAC